MDIEVRKDGTVLHKGKIKQTIGELRKKVKIKIYDKYITMDVANMVYKKFIGEIPEDMTVKFRDLDPSNCDVRNLTLYSGKFSKISKEKLDNFIGIKTILDEAKLTEKDFNFLKNHMSIPPANLSKNSKIKWERIMFKLVDARRDFLNYELTSPVLETFVDELVKPLKYSNLKESITRSNFKKKIIQEGLSIEEFLPVRDFEADTKDLKYYFIPLELLNKGGI